MPRPVVAQFQPHPLTFNLEVKIYGTVENKWAINLLKH